MTAAPPCSHGPWAVGGVCGPRAPAHIMRIDLAIRSRLKTSLMAAVA